MQHVTRINNGSLSIAVFAEDITRVRKRLSELRNAHVSYIQDPVKRTLIRTTQSSQHKNSDEEIQEIWGESLQNEADNLTWLFFTPSLKELISDRTGCVVKMTTLEANWFSRFLGVYEKDWACRGKGLCSKSHNKWSLLTLYYRMAFRVLRVVLSG